MAEYRVDELARTAGTSVRNVRVYQDRGLLAPPRREGRIGWYSDEHLERLRLIGRLLERGYTFATIAELLEAWNAGGSLGDVLGLSDAIGGPWSQERPCRVTIRELRSRFGAQATSDTVRRAVELGLLEQDGLSFLVPSPWLLEAGADLVDAGVPLSAVLDIATGLRTQMDSVAELLFNILRTSLVTASSAAVAGHAVAADPTTDASWNGHEPGDQATDVRLLAETVVRLRPHALRAVEATFAMAMREQAEAVLTSMAHRHQLASAADATRPPPQ